MIRRTVFALLAVLLAACNNDHTAVLPPPQEPGPDAVGVLCHMALSEHGGPKGQVLLKEGDGRPGAPLWFSSVHDTFVWLLEDDGLDKAVAAVWVNDMGRARTWDHPEAGAWVEAHAALYVVGSDREAAMGGGEFVPFADRAAAESFAAGHGGRIIPFSAIKEVLRASAEPAHHDHS